MSPLTLTVLRDAGVNVFGHPVQWLCTKSLVNQFGHPAYQHRLTDLTLLAKRLKMPQWENNAINALENRWTLERGIIKVKTLEYAYANTAKGDLLRKDIVDV